MFSCSILFFKVKSTPVTVSEKRQWEQEQQIRRENVREQCSSLGLETNVTAEWLDKHGDNLRFILVSDIHKALYCYVPKAACTNWKRVFLVLNRFATQDKISQFTMRKIHFTEVPTLNRYSTKDILHRLQTYTTFLVVRNPFTRMLSTYREKYETDKSETSRRHRKELGNFIHMKYGNHPELERKEPPTGGYNVTFQEYAKYIGDRELAKSLSSRRWKVVHSEAMIDICLPCTVEYDIIGHLETLKSDAANILERIRASEYMDLVVGQSFHGTNSSQREILSKYYDQLTEDDIEGIRWRYKWDFEVFGYSEKIPAD